MESKAKAQPSWFERNPKKTLLLFLCIILIAITYTAEKILAHLNFSDKLVLFLDKRYINLRECLPLIDVVDTPTDKALRESDGLVRQAYRIRTDANGFLLPYHRYEHPDVTLVFLGGSTTACLFVEEENRFPVLVGEFLEQDTGKKVTSINGGVGGNNTLHCINILLNKVIPLKPDMVFLMENINDLVSLIYDQTYWSKNPSRATIVEFTFYKNLKGFKALSTLARDIYIPNLHVATRVLSKKLFGKAKDPDDEFAHVRGKKQELHRAELMEEFTLNLQTFINICRARKITPVLMTQFSRYKANPDPKVLRAARGFEADSGISVKDFLEIYAQFNQTIVEVARANGVQVIDLARLVPQEPRYIYDVVHLNTAGSRLVARLVADQLRPVVASWKAASPRSGPAPESP